MKKIYTENQVTVRISYEQKDHIPMCGWHANYADFKDDNHEGTVVFIGEHIGVSIDHKHSFTIKVEDLVDYCISQLHGKASK